MADPNSAMVIRQVTPGITTFSVPFTRGVFKFGGRGTLGSFSSHHRTNQTANLR
jgi:hypothetical protein